MAIGDVRPQVTPLSFIIIAVTRCPAKQHCTAATITDNELNSLQGSVTVLCKSAQYFHHLIPNETSTLHKLDSRLGAVHKRRVEGFHVRLGRRRKTWRSYKRPERDGTRPGIRGTAAETGGDDVSMRTVASRMWNESRSRSRSSTGELGRYDSVCSANDRWTRHASLNSSL